jgi:hypothetical protein
MSSPRFQPNQRAMKGGSSIFADTRWISNQPPLSGFHGMYPSEPQQGTLPSSVSSFDTELDKLHLGNTVQQAPGVPSPAEYPGTGSESKTVLGSADRAKIPAFKNMTNIAVPRPGDQAYTPHEMMIPSLEVAYDSSFGDEVWQYSSGDGTVPTFTLAAEVEDFPYQNTPTQWVSAKPEDGDAGHLVVKQKYTRSSLPQTALSQKLQQKLYKFVPGRVEKRSRDKRSTACVECGRRKVRCTVVSPGGSCQPCARADHRCTWNRRSGMGERGNIRFKHCRPVQA